jgi:hypothetical protein
MTQIRRQFPELRRRLLALTLAAAAGGLGAGCASEPGPPPLDTLRLNLDFGGGVTLTSVDYIMKGPANFSQVGTLSVADQPNITATFQNLPPGMNYTISVRGTASDNLNQCKGDATFNVVANMDTVVQIALTCSGRGIVTADVDICPIIDSLSAVPAEVYVGASLQLGLTAHDPDNGPGPLTATWQTTSGTLSNLSTTGATFTCTDPGTFTIGAKVSDGSPVAKCADTATVTVVCTPVPHAEAVVARTAPWAG